MQNQYSWRQAQLAAFILLQFLNFWADTNHYILGVTVIEDGNGVKADAFKADNTPPKTMVEPFSNLNIDWR